MIINTNDTLSRIQKALSLTMEQMIEAYTLEEYEIEASHLQSLMAGEKDKDFILCSYEELGIFLDGLVTLKRGVSPKKAPSQEGVELTNNLILKKLTHSPRTQRSRSRNYFWSSRYNTKQTTTSLTLSQRNT